MNIEFIVNTILSEVKEGKTYSLTLDNFGIINLEAVKIIKSCKDESYRNSLLTTNGNIYQLMENIIRISNILYNNTDRTMLPLEDGVYDILLEIYKSLNPNYQVGAEPVHFENTENGKLKSKLIQIVKVLEQPDKEEFLFLDQLNARPKLTKKDVEPIVPVDINTLSVRRVGDATHSYPKLVGTLDKAKFVINSQAITKGVFEDANVKVLERDFFGKHIMSGILQPNRVLKMVLELKYDGVSVEADVSDKIHSARSRGDANEGLATDLTPLLGGYPFKQVEGILEPSETLGMKFEAIMTYFNLCRFNELKGKDYKNCRTAISGLFSGSDALQYRHLITLVPLATSINDIDRVAEIEFMNKYYHSGEFLRYAVIEGNYLDCLFQIKRFVEEAEYMRDILPFMYDGVVVSYADKDLIEALGRKNSVNLYSMAVKFNPLKKLTTFRGYTFTVGKDGSITPMIHYDAVEFYGTIHDKSTGHSYDRFKTLSLKVGDLIDVEYVNDVMPYVTKPDNSHNANNTNPLFAFIDTCPSCGNKLILSDSQKSIYCDNIDCPERNIKRIVSMIDKLNIKDFSESYLTQIGKYSLSELLDLTIEDLSFLGDLTSRKFMDRMNELKTKPIYDYTIIGSLGFDGVGREKWKLILAKLTLQEILAMTPDLLAHTIMGIKGVGPVTAITISKEIDFFRNDLIAILGMSNVIVSKGVREGKSIRFTGFRDKVLLNTLVDMGHNATDGSITKTTEILLVPHEGFTSTKTAKVGPNTQIIAVQEFVENMEKYLIT